MGILVEPGPPGEGTTENDRGSHPCLLKQGPSQLKAGGFSRVPPPSRPSSSGTRGVRRREAGAPGRPRASAWECGQRGVTGGGAGRRGPGEGRGPGGGKRSGPPAGEAQGPRPTPSCTPSAPSSRGPRHYGGAVPLPLPGSAALPAPRTPSFRGLTNLSPLGEASPKRPRSRSPSQTKVAGAEPVDGGRGGGGTPTSGSPHTIAIRSLLARKILSPSFLQYYMSITLIELNL